MNNAWIKLAQNSREDMPLPLQTADMGSNGPERGWTIRQGIYQLLADYIPGFHQSLLADPSGIKIPNYLHFEGVSGTVAEQLLQLVPSEVLKQCQNHSPTTACLLTAAAKHPGEVYAGGYLISAQTSDERLIVEYLTIYGYEDYYSPQKAANHWGKQRLWKQISRDLKLEGYRSGPDELARIRPSYNLGRKAWWLWWD